ncbi:MAG TPA: hypothetical protein VH912_24900 [Streptosporangiaceae bacterium]|jgi:hypothetical protein
MTSTEPDDLMFIEVHRGEYFGEDDIAGVSDDDGGASEQEPL